MRDGINFSSFEPIYFSTNQDKEVNQNLINPEIIRENYNLIKDSLNALIKVIELSKDPSKEIKKLKKQTNIILPSQFLKSSDIKELNIKKDRIRKINSKFEDNMHSISESIENAKNGIKNMNSSLNETQEKINNYANKFYNNMYNLYIPLLNKKNYLDSINYQNFSNEDKETYFNTKRTIIEEINVFLLKSKEFIEDYLIISKTVNSELQKIIQNFYDSFEEIKNISYLTYKDCLKFEEIVNSLDGTEKKTILIIKEMNEMLKEISNKKLNFLSNKTKLNFEGINERLVEKTNSIIEEIEKKSNEISKKIEELINLNEKYGGNIEKPKQIKLINIEEEIKNIIDLFIRVQKDIDRFREKWKEQRLDILFITDITSSMDDYLDYIKIIIFKILEYIKDNFHNIDLFVGFIGYKDIGDREYINIDFTNKHRDIEKKIKDIIAEGGDDIPEDLSGAFELAKQKNWKGKKKFVVLFTDAPCHGSKYHNSELNDNHLEEETKRKIEDYIKYFAEENISLFCVKISELTGKMFDLFQKVYFKNKKKSTNCELVIDKSNRIYNMIIEKAKKFNNFEE